MNGTNFLSDPFNYGLLLNIDWFEPFEHRTYAVGVIYLVILNLPPTLRFKKENVILFGVMPGPSEPPLTVNTYLAPLVSDLLDFWKGVEYTLPGTLTSQKVRCALLGVSCDLPAAKKTVGFLSHSASLGCSKCLYRFFDGSGSADYGGNFNRDSWVMRTNEAHRRDIVKIQECETKTAKAKAEMKHGCRYSVLLDLPYFDPVRALLIDPMHNLFLGTAKHFAFDVLIEKKILGKADLSMVSHRLKSMQPVPGLGRLPTSIALGTFLTAEQWMNWTLYYSIYCLHGLIPSNQLECWRHFVLACRRLCKFSLTQDDLVIADTLLLRFCKKFNELYGRQALTPNIHMHCHLVSCLKDFGPFRSFWLFPFERYNGILGEEPTNNRSIELQLMRRFCHDNSRRQLAKTTGDWQFSDVFGDLLLTAHETSTDPVHTEQSHAVKLGTKYVISAFSTEEVLTLKKVYAKMYPHYSEEILSGKIIVPSSFKMFSSILKEGRIIRASTSTKFVYVLGTPTFPFSTSRSSEFEGCKRVVKMHYFVEHSIPLHPEQSEPTKNQFAFVSWPMVHPKRFHFGKPVEVWCNELFEPNTDNDFLPLTSIADRVMFSVDKVDDESVLIIVPIIES